MVELSRYSYDCQKYNFCSIIQELFDCVELCQIHKRLPAEIRYDELHEIGEDNKTWYHQKFYAPINDGRSQFQELYLCFVQEVVSELINENKFLYQKTPTFRVHTPNNVAVGGWHKDSDYNHPSGEINFIVPLTDARDTSTIWTETQPGKADFQPISMELGDIVKFNGNECVHGNKVNETGTSRVSFDFRVLPFDKYNSESPLRSISANRQFILGDYYNLHEGGYS